MKLTEADLNEIIRVLRTGQYGGITECDTAGEEKKFMWELKITELK